MKAAVLVAALFTATIWPDAAGSCIAAPSIQSENSSATDDCTGARKKVLRIRQWLPKAGFATWVLAALNGIRYAERHGQVPYADCSPSGLAIRTATSLRA